MKAKAIARGAVQFTFPFSDQCIGSFATSGAIVRLA
jgi:hypothetical protein